MSERRKILVTGATGRQGRAVALRLLESGEPVRVMTRSPDTARQLGRMGAEVVHGDFDRYLTLVQALRGVRGVFLVSTPLERGPGAEVEQGRAMVYACMDEEVPHLVYSSVCCADRDTGIPHFDSKREIEEYIRNSGLDRTIFRPVSFMENFVTPRMRASFEEDSLELPLDPKTVLQMISVSDVAEFCCEAFRRPEKFIGAELDLAGDQLTVEEAVQDLSCTMNRRVRYRRIPDDEAEERFGYDVATMYGWLNEEGFDVDIQALRRRYGVPLTPFRRYLSRSILFRKAA
jgi:uncharacterized protein YbjT (DUF2867 family)